MDTHIISTFTSTNALAAMGIALVYIFLSSLVKEPERQKLSAVIVAGAGAAYLSSGLGIWEFVFCIIMTFVAYKGLKHYYWIGLAWLMHTAWDVVHHVYANPIVPLAPSSSAGCAVCDFVIALWFFCKAPALFNIFHLRTTFFKHK